LCRAPRIQSRSRLARTIYSVFIFLKIHSREITTARLDGQWIKAAKSWTIRDNFS
jgi:hypothetical protein